MQTLVNTTDGNFVVNGVR